MKCIMKHSAVVTVYLLYNGPTSFM